MDKNIIKKKIFDFSKEAREERKQKRLKAKALRQKINEELPYYATPEELQRFHKEYFEK